MTEIMDVRVGYATISVLKNLCEEYIRAHTTNNKYVGKLEMLIKYDKLEKIIGRVKS